MSRQSIPTNSPPLATTREREGYDGIRNGVRWWFEAWGNGPKAKWTNRAEIGRPPTPSELRCDFVVVGLQRGNHVDYRTKTGGLDL